ncbi:MAG: nucleotidyltransferase family protein [Campylobacterales bacterium]
MKKDEILNFLKANKEALRSRYGVEKLGLFGSFSRNEANENSDIDILFEVGNGVKLSLFDYLKLSAYLEENLHQKVDLVREAKLKEALKPYVYKDIVYA